MVYNIRKTKHEWKRQYALQESWSYIHKSLEMLDDMPEEISRKKYRMRVIRWCDDVLRILRNINVGYKQTKPEQAVRLLRSRAIGDVDSPWYNFKQLKIHCSRHA